MNSLARKQNDERAGDTNASSVGLKRDGRSVRLPLLSTYLEEQQRLSAVERFAQHHEQNSPPTQARYYEDLIPSAKPGTGQQYGFSVDLDRCTGCKACVTACRSLNGLDEGETWRSVGFVHGGTAEAPFQQTVTTACHHCVDPGCMKGCPVGAYEKDPITGIVRHLDDQCIGCQYCTLTCPYEVPQYSERLGIVRKCDMCSDRLESGEAPACVQACPSEAISIRLVETADAVARATGTLVPEAPRSSLTVPTTEYTTKRTLPANLVPADFDDLRPATPHTPLAVMLVLSQGSAGAFLVSTVLGQGGFATSRQLLSLLALSFGIVGLVSSPMHLGRPQYGFRAILGVRTSWLSREILAFGAFAPVAMLYTASLFAGEIGARLGLPPPDSALLHSAQNLLGVTTVLAAFTVVACSMMVYAITGRSLWSVPRTFVRFFSSAAVSGLAMALAVAGAASGAGGTLVVPLALALVLAAAYKLAHEAAIFRELSPESPADLRRTAKILLGPLKTWTAARALLGATGGVLLPLVVALVGGSAGPWASPVVAALAILAWAFVLGGEFLERELFFRAASAPRMPGGVTR